MDGETTITRIDPRSDSYSALMWDVITNAHRYNPRRGDRVLDLGAHYGMFALYCAARGAEVHAYEPQRIPYRELCHTAEVAAEIGYGHIWPHKAAVMSFRQDNLELRKAVNGTSATASAVRGGEGEAVEIVTAEAFDDVLTQKHFDHWDCVKMDVEGVEYELILDSKFLDRIYFLTVEIHNDILTPDQTEAVRSVLAGSFQHIDRLPRKDKPEQTVAYFCRR